MLKTGGDVSLGRENLHRREEDHDDILHCGQLRERTSREQEAGAGGENTHCIIEPIILLGFQDEERKPQRWACRNRICFEKEEGSSLP